MSRRALGSLLLVALLGAGRVARADDDADLRGLLEQNVVSTASKSAETETAAPATSTTLTAEDMRRYGIHSLAEAIDFLSLGVVTADPLRSVDIGARGVMLPRDQGDHFLLLVDGHQLNEPLFGMARFERGLGIPLEMVDHIEVILGPGSVLYGSNAMLGVINVITKRAKDWSGGHVAAESEIGKSYRGVLGAGLELTLFGKPASLTGGVEAYTQSGPTFGFGPQYFPYDQASGEPVRFTRNGPATGVWGGQASHSYYSSVNDGFLRFEAGRFELTLNAKTYERAQPYRSRFQHSVTDFDDASSYELDRHLWGEAKYGFSLSPVVQASVRVYGDTFDYQNFDNSSYASACIYEGVRTCHFITASASRWAGVELQTTLDWFKDASFVTLLGVDGRLRHGASKFDVQDYDTGRYVAPSSALVHDNDHTVGAYAQQTWNVRPFGFNAGVRYDAVEGQTGVASPRVAATVSPWAGGTLKAIYAEAFRSPTFYEQNVSSRSQVRAHHLEPERVRSVEASLEQRFGAQRLLFGLFRSSWSNLVEAHGLSLAEAQEAAQNGEASLTSGSLIQFRNVSSIDNYGLNAGYEGALFEGALRYGANLTAAYAHSPSQDPRYTTLPLSVTPSIFGNARIAYDLPGAWPTIALAAQAMGKRAGDRAFIYGFTPTPYAPPQLALRATISGDVPGVRGLTYRASANWMLADRAPYVVGPAQDGTPDNPKAELVPVDTFRTTVGLGYDF